MRGRMSELELEEMGYFVSSTLDLQYQVFHGPMH